MGEWAIVCEEGKTAWYLLRWIQENEIRTWKIVSFLASKANIEQIREKSIWFEKIASKWSIDNSKISEL